MNPSVTFSAVAGSRAAAKALAREWFVGQFAALQAGGLGKEAALQAACGLVHESGLTMSPGRLRVFVARHAAHGLDGLVDQKRGVVGRKPAAAALTEEQLFAARAAAQESGSAAFAFRRLTLRDDLSADARLHVHQAFASKSHVPKSIGKALKSSPLLTARLQGHRAARLDGRFTERDYSAHKAGDWFVADDMTSNVLCWVDDPTAEFGWRIAQAQLLPVADICSLRWLNLRLIIRDGGQYNAADDIWGLFGDTFDSAGLPHRGMVLEGGHWQANAVIGHRTGLSDDDRIGGLRSLGLDMRRSYDPRSKQIEGMFNGLQRAMDLVPGWAGRDQRKQMPEALKAKLQAAKSGKLHPSEFLLRNDQLATHIWEVMGNLNQERNDGTICRGLSPDQKWIEDGAAERLRFLPDSARWLYRSAMDLVAVTRNGLLLTRGSGPKRRSFRWDNPELLTPLRGAKVIVYWNDHRPEADAVLLSLSRKFLGIAKSFGPIDAFDATDEQLSDEAARKTAERRFVATEVRTLTPYLTRRAAPSPVLPAPCSPLEAPGSPLGAPCAVDRQTAAVGEELRAAIARTEERTAERQATARRVRELGPEALADLLEPAPRPRSREPEAEAVDLLAELV
jgi:hypothetical protein